jgi:hypothetical protein
LTAVDQASSIFWNSRTSGLSVEVTLGWAGVEAGAGAGFWATVTKQESRTAKKQAIERVIRSMNSHLQQFSEIGGQLK